jgi:methyl-accepting chemotaxis protein
MTTVWMSNNRVRVALTLFVVTVLSTGMASWFVASRMSAEHLEAHRSFLMEKMESRRENVERYFDRVDNIMALLGNSRIVQEALQDFTVAFDELGEQKSAVLQRQYISENPNPPGSKHALLRAKEEVWYNELHERYHEWIRGVLRTADLYDIFLVSLEGDVVYTVLKESDFATNLSTGPYKDTELASLFTQLTGQPPVTGARMIDFVPYAPSEGAPAAFIGTTVQSGDETVGVIIFQLKAEPLNDIARGTESTGRGSIYFVGPDFLLRGHSLEREANTILKTPVDSEAVKSAIAGLSDVRVFNQGSGRRVLAGYGPLQWYDQRWAVIAEIPLDELAADNRRTLIGAAMVVLLLSLVAGLLGYWAAASDQNSVTGSDRH